MSRLTYKGVEMYLPIYFDSSNFMGSFQMTILLFHCILLDTFMSEPRTEIFILFLKTI